MFGSSSLVRWWKRVPGSGDHLGGRERVDRDVVVVEFGGQAGGEPFQGRLAHAVDGPAAAGPAGGRERRVPGGDRGDVHDPAPALLPHPRHDQLGQVERALHLDVEHELEAARGEFGDRGEVGDGGVADQDVRRAELVGGFCDEALPVLRLGQVGADRHRRAAGRADLLGGLGDGAGERGGAVSVVRAATATAAPSAANRRAISAPMPRLAPVTMATLPSRMPMAVTPRVRTAEPNTRRKF